MKINLELATMEALYELEERLDGYLGELAEKIVALNLEMLKNQAALNMVVTEIGRREELGLDVAANN